MSSLFPNLDWQHVLAPFAGAGLTAFLDYEVNSASPFSRSTLEHAALAAALVVAAMLKSTPLAAPAGTVVAAPKVSP